jgi:hypothetical protein
MDLYDTTSTPEQVNNKCGVAFNNIFLQLIQSQQASVASLNNLLNIYDQMPDFIRDNNLYASAREHVEFIQQKNTGEVQLKMNLDQDVLALMGYSAQGDTEPSRDLASWLIRLLAQYYPEAATAANNQAIQTFVTTHQDQNLVFLIESPTRCDQTVTTEVHSKRGFGEYGFGSFMASFKSNNFIFDGEYRFKLVFENRNTAVRTDLVEVKTEIAPFMRLSAAQLAERALHPQGSETMIEYPLTMSEVIKQVDDSDRLHLQIKNNTANYFDLKMESVGNYTAPPKPDTISVILSP